MKTAVYKTLEAIGTSEKYNFWIYSHLKDYLRGDVLDIGSGLGDIIQFYDTPSVNKIIAADYADEMIDHLGGRFACNKKYQPLKLDIAADHLEVYLPHFSFDTISCINTLEHITDDIKALKNMHKLLKRGGRLVLLVPAFPQIYGTFDSLVGHFRRYTKKTLREAINQTPFKITGQYYTNFFGVFTWFLAGRVLKQKSFNSKTCQKLDKIVPILKALESGIKPPIGQSVVTVCTA